MIDENILDPKSFPNSKKDKKGALKIKKNSLRGNSLFVQMAKCKVKSADDFEILDEYAYNNQEDTLTLSITQIEGNRNEDSNRNLLQEMGKIHHILKEIKVAKKFRELKYKNEARDLNTPIYVSYKPIELEKYNKEKHKDAYYYAEGFKQPIGVIQLNKLKKGTENEK